MLPHIAMGSITPKIYLFHGARAAKSHWLTLGEQHDAVLDYYGRRLATCSTDRTIKIFEIEGDQQRLSETLKG